MKSADSTHDREDIQGILLISASIDALIDSIQHHQEKFLLREIYHVSYEIRITCGLLQSVHEAP